MPVFVIKNIFFFQIAEYKKIVPRDKIIVYDIGLTEEQIKMLSNICNVEIEKFNFDEFPKYVKILTNYRWKPIVITVRKILLYLCTLMFLESSSKIRFNNLC